MGIFIPNPAVEALLAVNPLMGSAMEDIAEEIADKATSAAPRDTGALADSIEGGAVLEGGTWKARVVAEVDYAAYVEFGTSDTPAQPFLRPAADEVAG